MAKTFFCAALVLVAGCALEQEGQWLRPDTTEAQWKQDNYECTRDATYYTGWMPYSAFHWRHPHSAAHHHYIDSVPRIDRYLYEMCLDARGYTWKPDDPQ